MKKLVTTLTALVFALGLTAAGYSQTTATKEGAKPAVKTQTPAATTQVAPVDKDQPKAKEADKTAAKEADPAKGKQPEMVSKKDDGKKPAAPATETKKEETKGTVK